jgi:glycosyltransferase involved in cell wall biosynthesis
MKYRLIMPALLYGGGPRNNYTLCAHLKKRGFNAKIVALTDRTRIPAKLGGYKSPPDLSGAEVRTLVKPIGLLNQLSKIAAEENELFVPVQLLAGAISTILTAEQACYVATAWQTAFAAQALSNMQGIRGLYFAQAYETTFREKKIYKYFASQTYKYPLIRFSQSAWLAKFLDNYYGGKTYYLGMGINHDAFKPPKVIRHDRRIVTIARDDPAKGFPVFVKALNHLRKKRSDFKVVIIGEKAALEKNKVDFPYEFGGWISKDETLATFYQGSIFVNTGIHEALPMPPIEAMACGATVVLTNMDGAKEYTVDNENCLLAPIGDAKALSQRLDEALSNENLREKLSLNAIRTANRYTWDAVVEKFQKMVQTEGIE